MDQNQAPLFEALKKHTEHNSVSFHVPGHKSGKVFTSEAESFHSLLPYDLTELQGLDDLHQPEGPIKQAELLASDLYQTDQTFF